MPIAELALNLLISVIGNAGAISQLITTAKTQGRDITLAELQSLMDADVLARANFVIAIAAAKAKGL